MIANHRTLIGLIIILTMTGIEEINAQSKGNYANVNGLKMYYEIHGTGSPLVLIHGGGSTLYTTFGKILPILAKTHKVIGVELQAHGHTADRNTPSSFEQDADDVAELLMQLDVGAADIFGFSNGGNTAMQLAIRHPRRVNKLVISSSFYKRTGMINGFWDFMKNGTFEDMPQVYKDEYLKINPSQEGLQAMYNRDAARMLAFSDWKDDDLKSIKAPSLIVIGDHDVVKPEHAIEMSHLMPVGRLAILPGGHGSYMGEIMSAGNESKIAELFVEMIREYLEEP
jgi:pimeloyl-ACP methyl ester carboxylesterase